MTPRPSREEALVATAFAWALRSTCSRLQVGAVIDRDGRILTQGYNGAPAGMPHCNHECNCSKDWWEFHGKDGAHSFGCPSIEPCLISVHAEANAIAFAARHGVGLEGSRLTSTHEPCLNCAMLIVNSGIEAVNFVHPYRLHDGLNLLLEAGIRVEEGLDWEEPKVIG